MTDSSRPPEHYLLICSVGGTPDPVVKSLVWWEPDRVLFIPSEQTRPQVDTILRAFAEAANQPLGPGQYVTRAVSDPEDFSGCVEAIHALDGEVSDWLSRSGGDYHVIVDFTAGTKCMTAALALVAHRWHCDYSYVGGQRRTKAGVGVVESGTERVVHSANPWNTLGYQAIEDACLLFDQHAFAPAAKLLDETRKAADDKSVKRTLSTLHQLCDGYGLWDRFQHKEAAHRIDTALKNVTDIQQALRIPHTDDVIRSVREHRKFLQRIIDAPCSREMVVDLMANAQRRKKENRFDDGVARLYRTIEAIAQLALAERHEIPATDDVALDIIPEPLREAWAKRAEEGRVRLGLQDAYELLGRLNDPVGKIFKELKLHDPQHSSLTARNQSVLAHGFQPVSEKIFNQLWGAAMRLSDLEETKLPAFPTLARTG